MTSSTIDTPVHTGNDNHENCKSPEPIDSNNEKTEITEDQAVGEPEQVDEHGMGRKTVSFERTIEDPLTLETLDPANTMEIDVEICSSFEDSPNYYESDRLDVVTGSEEEELEGQSDDSDHLGCTSSAGSGRTESAVSAQDDKSLSTKGDPTHCITQSNRFHESNKMDFPSRSPSMSRQDLTEPDSYSISTMSTLQSYTSSQLDNTFYLNFEDREPAFIDVEEIQSRDAFGFLIPEEHEKNSGQNPAALLRYHRRIEKWREMVYGATSGYQKSIQEQHENWQDVTKHRKLKARIRKGIPSEFRREVWVYISGSRDLRLANPDIYHHLLNSGRASGFEDQIWKDIARTYRQHICFKEENSEMQQALFNVLNTYAIYNDDVGYCQGMNSVAALMLMYMEEVDVFWVIDSLCNDPKYSMQGVWHPTMPQINLRFFQFEHLVRYFLPKVANHLEENDIISCSQYQASQWFITGFLATKIPTHLLMRMWDIYLNEGIKALFRFGLAIIMHFKNQILASDMETILTTLGTQTATLTEDFITQAMSIRITRSMLGMAEAEFFKHKYPH